MRYGRWLCMNVDTLILPAHYIPVINSVERNEGCLLNKAEYYFSINDTKLYRYILRLKTEHDF